MFVIQSEAKKEEKHERGRTTAQKEEWEEEGKGSFSSTCFTSLKTITTIQPQKYFSVAFKEKFLPWCAQGWWGEGQGEGKEGLICSMLCESFWLISMKTWSFWGCVMNAWKLIKFSRFQIYFSCQTFDDFVEMRLIWWFNTFKNIEMNIISVFMFVKQWVTSANWRLDFHILYIKPQNVSIWPQIWGLKIDDQHA